MCSRIVCSACSVLRLAWASAPATCLPQLQNVCRTQLARVERLCVGRLCIARLYVCRSVWRSSGWRLCFGRLCIRRLCSARHGRRAQSVRGRRAHSVHGRRARADSCSARGASSARSCAQSVHSWRARADNCSARGAGSARCCGNAAPRACSHAAARRVAVTGCCYKRYSRRHRRRAALCNSSINTFCGINTLRCSFSVCCFCFCCFSFCKFSCCCCWGR